MTTAPVYDLQGNRLGDQELPESVFGDAPHVGVMHQALVRQEANGRLGTHSTQTRTDVNRTKSKWYRQKGTGRARHGSRAAPIFVGGGVSHGPQPHGYRQRMPRKMRRLALRSALAAKAAASGVALVQGLELDVPRTKTIGALVEAIGGGAALFLLAGRNENVERSIRNLPRARYLDVAQLNVRDLLRQGTVVIDHRAIEPLVAHLGTPAQEAVDA